MKAVIAVLLSLALAALCLGGCGAQESPGAAGENSLQEAEREESQEAGDPPAPEEAEPEPDPEEDGEAESPLEEDTEEPLDTQWQFDSPENQGMDGEVLETLHSALENTQVYAALTVRNGYIVDEYYREGYDETSVFQFNSCSKSFTSALVGIAIHEGLIDGVDVPISRYFPQVEDTEKEEITIRQLLEHTSGIEWYEFGGSATSFFEMNQADNWVEYVLGQQMVAEPGATFTYTTGGTHLLAAILEQSVEGTMLDYAMEHLFDPLDMDSVHWRADPQDILDGGNGIEMTVRDAAKFGQLFLNGGSWDGRQLVPGEWVAESTDVQVPRSGNYGSYGYQWWIRSFAGYDTFYAMGAFGQFILVVPELDLVAVITSDRTGGTDTPYSFLSNYILAACS